MALALSKHDIEKIAWFKEFDEKGRLFEELQTNWNFTVGDVLIRYLGHRFEGEEKQVDLISTACPVPRKYRVMHIDKFGLPWVKTLSMSGGMGATVNPLCNLWRDGHYEFVVDPEQVDSIILGYQYDPRDEYRKMRQRNTQYGKKK